MRIRLARHDARPGDLFTPPIAMALRRASDLVDTHLVLIDLDADIVVDYMLDVMCQTC